MNKWIVIVGIVLVLCGNVWAYSSPTPKAEGGYVLVDTATGNQTPLSAAQKSWRDINSDANWVRIPTSYRAGYLSLTFEFTSSAGNNANAGAADVNVYFARPYGSAKRAARINVQAGDIQASHDPNSGVAYRTSGVADPNHKFADYIYRYTDVNEWKSNAYTSGADGNEVGGNVGTFDIDPLLEQFIRVEFYNVSGTGITQVRCFMAGGNI